MQNDQIYSEIINLISTKDDYNTLNDEIDLLGKSLYAVKDGFDTVLKNRIRKEISVPISKLIEFETKEEVLNKLKEKLKSIKFMEVTISFKPTEELIDKIVSKLISKDHQNIALDIKVDPKIIGGALISFQGKYYDGSVRSKLNEVLKNYV